MSGESLRKELAYMAPKWQPRGMAIICAMSAALSVFIYLFPLSEPQRAFGRPLDISMSFTASFFYWILASYFRVWMVHVIVLFGLFWGLSSVAAADGQTTAALLLVTLLWTGIFIGASFSPRVSRLYEVLICAGIAVAMALNGVPGAAALGIVFGLSFIVVMELLSWVTSRLRSKAATDPVTGLLNRHGLEEAVDRVRSFGRDPKIAVLLADLDEFKTVNDVQGHRAGDQLLREFAGAWTKEMRSGDLVARLGGDEFVAVFPIEAGTEAEETVSRLRRKSPALWSGGLVLMQEGESFSACLERADHLMYVEKNIKRGDLQGI